MVPNKERKTKPTITLPRENVLVFSSVGVSAMAMCPRLVYGHLNQPRSALFFSA
jgi:hypothetical protein